MKRRGRKRKAGVREPNGQLQRPTSAGDVEKQRVLAQPHRHGDLDQFRESPLGRFVIFMKLDRDVYTAGLAYGSLVRRYYAAKGIPQPLHDGYPASGDGVSPEIARMLGRILDRIDPKLKKVSVAGFSAAKDLTVHETEVAKHYFDPAASVLRALGREMNGIPIFPLYGSAKRSCGMGGNGVLIPHTVYEK